MTTTFEDQIAAAIEEATAQVYAERSADIAYVLDVEGLRALPLGIEVMDAQGDLQEKVDDTSIRYGRNTIFNLTAPNFADVLFPLQVELADLGEFKPAPKFQVGDHVRVLEGHGALPYLEEGQEGVVSQVGHYTDGPEWVSLRGNVGTWYSSRFEKFEPAPVRVESFDPLEYPTIHTIEDLDALPNGSVVARPEAIFGTTCVKKNGRFYAANDYDLDRTMDVTAYRKSDLRYSPLVVLYAPGITTP